LRKVEIKHGKLPINPAKSEDRAKSATMFISGQEPVLVVRGTPANYMRSGRTRSAICTPPPEIMTGFRLIHVLRKSINNLIKTHFRGLSNRETLTLRSVVVLVDITVNSMLGNSDC
jgi:hypothetical protein